jgi:hypothetical protein
MTLSRSQAYSSFFQDIFSDLWVVWKGFDDFMTHINGIHIALSLQIVESELVANLQMEQEDMSLPQQYM